MSKRPNVSAMTGDNGTEGKKHTWQDEWDRTLKERGGVGKKSLIAWATNEILLVKLQQENH